MRGCRGCVTSSSHHNGRWRVFKVINILLSRQDRWIFFWVVMMPNLCLAAEESSSTTEIGRIMGMFLFGYLVMKFANRRKP